MSLIKTSIIACTVVNLTPKGNHHLPEIRSIVHSAAYTQPIRGCSLYVGAAYTWVNTVISPHNITIETHIKVTRIKGMITC